jgi:GH25 family lysozyme M1 (1,4-beta-N-acetylmuramidase)
MSIFGLDIYFGDDAPGTPRPIDFVKMKAAGALYVIIKAGQNMWEDPLYREHVARAKDAGLITGAYYFLDRRTPLPNQAAHFVDLCKAAPTNLPPWLDFEITITAAEAGTFRLALKSAALVVKDGIGRCGLYTSRSKWAQLQTTDLMWVTLMPYLWLARYPLKPDGTKYKTLAEIANRATPTMAPWVKTDIWQFTDKADGLLYGIESLGADGNRFDGTLDDLRRLCVGLDVPQPPLTVEQQLADHEARIRRLEQVAGF